MSNSSQQSPESRPQYGRVRKPNEALPNTISFRDLPVWKPHSMEPARSGASDHLQHKSLGK